MPRTHATLLAAGAAGPSKPLPDPTAMKIQLRRDNNHERLGLILVSLFAIALLPAAASAQTDARLSHQAPDNLAPASNRKVISLDSDVLGIGFLNNFPHRTSTTSVNFNPIGVLVKDLGTSPAAINSFFPWKLQHGEYQAFPNDFCEYVNQFGSTPLITWPPGQANSANQVEDRDRTNPQSDFNCASISSGIHDEYIRSWAREAKAYGKPVYVRYMHEFIGAPYPTSYVLDNVNNSAENYKKAYRHITDIIREENADNIQNIWCVGEANKPPAADFYPGDGYVDWAGIDAYGRNAKPGKAKSFEQIFSQLYKRMVSFSKRPIIICEVSTVEVDGDPNIKANWWKDMMLKVVPDKMPRIRAVILFNSPGNPSKGYSYKFDTSPESMVALRGLFANPKLQGALPERRLPDYSTTIK